MHHDAVFKLASFGYHLVPWANRHAAKPSPLLKNFLTLASADPATLAGWLGQWPEADWAIVPRETVVLDLENKNGLDGAADMERLYASAGTSAGAFTAECAITRTKSDGRHYWFRMPANCTFRGGIHITDGVEVKRINGSAHVPPSMGYEWIRPLGRMQDLPELPQWFIDLWAERRTAVRETQPAARIFANGERNTAMCAFAAEARRTLGLDQDEMRELLLTIRRTRCEDPTSFSEEEVTKIADSYAKRDVESVGILAINGDPLAQSIMSLAFGSKMPHEVAAEVRAIDTPVKAVTLEDRDLYPTPLINKIMAYEKRKAFKFQPELSLLAICTALGVIMGRSYTFMGCHPNIYGAALSPTTSGKESTKRLLDKILDVSGFHDGIAGTITSDAGLLSKLTVSPETLWIEDEFTVRLQSFTRADAAQYNLNFIRMLLDIYTGSTIYAKASGNAAANVAAVEIKQPFLSIYSASQPGSYWKAMSQELICNGYLGRQSIFCGRPGTRINSEDIITRYTSKQTELVFPEDIAAILKESRAYTPTQRASNYADLQEIRMPADVLKHFVTIMDDYQDRMAKYDGESVEAYVSGRDMEKMERFALIHAWSLCPQRPVMTKDSLDWAYRIVRYSTDCALRGYNQRAMNAIASNSEVDAVFTIIHKAGENGITKANLTLKTQKLLQQRDRIIDELIASERIYCVKMSAGKRRPTNIYYAKEFFKEPTHAPTT